MGNGEIDCEKQREYLAKIDECEPYSIFTRIDRAAKGFVNELDLYNFMKENGIFHVTEEDSRNIVRFYDVDDDG